MRQRGGRPLTERSERRTTQVPLGAQTARFANRTDSEDEGGVQLPPVVTRIPPPSPLEGQRRKVQRKAATDSFRARDFGLNTMPPPKYEVHRECRARTVGASTIIAPLGQKNKKFTAYDEYSRRNSDGTCFFEGFRIGRRGLISVPESCLKPERTVLYDHLEETEVLQEMHDGVLLVSAVEKHSGEKVTMKKFLRTEERHLLLMVNELLVILCKNVTEHGKGGQHNCLGIDCTKCHLHIVNCRGVFVQADHKYIAVILEPLDLGSLTMIVKRKGPLPEPFLSKVLRQLIAGLAAMHSHDWGHMNITPDSIYVLHDGRVVFGDFGLSVSFKPPPPKAPKKLAKIAMAMSLTHHIRRVRRSATETLLNVPPLSPILLNGGLQRTYSMLAARSSPTSPRPKEETPSPTLPRSLSPDPDYQPPNSPLATVALWSQSTYTPRPPSEAKTYRHGLEGSRYSPTPKAKPKPARKTEGDHEGHVRTVKALDCRALLDVMRKLCAGPTDSIWCRKTPLTTVSEQMSSFVEAVQKVKDPYELADHPFITLYTSLSFPCLSRWVSLCNKASGKFACLLTSQAQAPPTHPLGLSSRSECMPLKVLTHQSQRMTDKEMRRLHTVFERYDSKNVRTLNQDEVRDLLHGLGDEGTSTSQVVKAMALMHKAYDPEYALSPTAPVTFEEFVAWWTCNWFNKFDA